MRQLPSLPATPHPAPHKALLYISTAGNESECHSVFPLRAYTIARRHGMGALGRLGLHPICFTMNVILSRRPTHKTRHARVRSTCMLVYCRAPFSHKPYAACRLTNIVVLGKVTVWLPIRWAQLAAVRRLVAGNPSYFYAGGSTRMDPVTGIPTIQKSVSVINLKYRAQTYVHRGVCCSFSLPESG